MTKEAAKKSDPFYREFELFESHFLNLRVTWTLFTTFHQDPENVAVINRAAPTTFHEIGRSLVEHMLVQLGRLTDLPVKGKPESLSLRKIIKTVDDCLSDQGRIIPEPYLFEEMNPGQPIPTRAQRDREFRAKLQQTRNDLHPILESLHAHRNKRIAHLDFAHAIGTFAEPLPALTFGDIDRALKLLEDLLNTISSYFWQSSTAFNYPYMRQPTELIEVLKAGVEAQELRRASQH